VEDSTIQQKRIWKQVRVPASLYAMNLAAFTSAGDRLASGSNINWNQMSDRVLPAKQPFTQPSSGNSTKRTLTSLKPGACSPGGQGVDVKHDSYARYLNRKKATNLKTQVTASVAIQGNKTRAIGLVENNSQCCK
jgi:hypothetical protein